MIGIQQQLPPPQPQPSTPSPPRLTAFLSSIPAGLPDDALEAILATFGPLHSWRRLTEPSGAAKPVGFAEFSEPAVLLSVERLLPRIELYQGRRVGVKLEETIRLHAISRTEEERGGGGGGEEEDGEVVSSRERDIRTIDCLISVFASRRMLHAVESARRLVSDYDRVFMDNKHERRHDDHQEQQLADREQRWLREEQKVLSSYREYQTTVTRPHLFSLDPDLFRTDRTEWRRMRAADRETECRFRSDRIPTDVTEEDPETALARLAASVPVDRPTLFAAPIEWEHFDVGRLRRWLVRQRGLLPVQADRVASYISRRLTPEQIAACVSSDILEPGDSGEMFAVRLWRWIVFDTRAAAAGLSV